MQDVGKISRKLNKLGVKTVIVQEPMKSVTAWQLGGSSSGWISPCEEDGSILAISNESPSMQEDGHNLTSYFAEVMIGPVKVRALVDSGASCSVLSSAIVKSSQQLLDSCVETEKTVRGVGNLCIRMEATLRTSLLVGNTKAKLNFAVVDSQRLPVDAIIGNNFLHTYGVIIDMGQGIMDVNGEPIKLIPKFSKIKKMVSPAYVCNDIIIPARSKMVIVSSTNTTSDESDGGAFFEPCQNNESGIWYGRSLSIQKDGKILVQVMNPLPEEVKLKAGTYMGGVFLIPQDPLQRTDKPSIEEGYTYTLIEELEVKQMKNPSELFNLDHVVSGKNDLIKLLDEFPQVVSMSDYDIGQAHLPPMVIDTGNAEPIAIPPRRMGPLQRDKLRKHIKAMNNAGILSHSSSSWSSPLVPVAKRDGDVRPCVDLRGLNNVTTFTAHPLPNIDEVLHSLKGSRVFSTLDLNKGFHQIRIAQGSTAKTAFPFEGNLYEYQRIAFGLKNAAGYFQKSMQIVLSGISSEECLIYIDDFLLHSPDIPSHLATLRKVFSRLAAYGLKVKPSKCQLMKDEVDYLGHIIREEGMTPLESRTQALIQYPRPLTSRALKRFVGMINYYRTFIPNCSSLLRPLTKAQSKTKLEWTDECQKSFDQVKNLITTAPVLAFPDYTSSEPLILTSDGSSCGAGGYLSQKQTGVERVIGYFSKVFSDSQAKLSATDKELEALREAIKFFRPYILDRKLILRVDHRPIVELSKAKHLNCRLFRIYELLRTFDISCEYIPGARNITSDALSRIKEGKEVLCSIYPVSLPDGLMEVKIPGGGDSLVRAFASTWLGDEERHMEVRTKLVNAIKRNPNQFQNLCQPQLMEPIKQWSIEGVQLPIEVAQVLATIYGVNITFYQAGTFPLVFSIPNPKLVVNLVLKDKIHINATAPIQLKEQLLCIEDYENLDLDMELRIHPSLTRKQILTWQESDQQLTLIKKALKYGWSKKYLNEAASKTQITLELCMNLENLYLVADIEAKKVQLNKSLHPALVPLIPQEVVPIMLEKVHQALCHVGERKMVDFIRSYFFFSNLREAVSKAVKECTYCKMGKVDSGTNRAKPVKIISDHPYHLVAMDLADFPRSERNNKYLFLAVDHYSKRAVGRPLEDKSGTTIAREFEYALLPSFIAVPERILTDNGGEFQNKSFEHLMNKYGIQHETIAPGFPASNGAVERLVGTVKSLLRVSCLQGSEWDNELPNVLNAYNNTKHKEINMKPSEVFLEKAARVVLPNRKQNTDGRTHKPLSKGDRVLKKVDNPPSKMSMKYEPGFVVEQVNSKGLTYVVRRLDPIPGQLSLLKAHHNQLRYHGPEERSQSHPKVDKPSMAVKTLQKLGQQTIKPSLPGNRVNLNMMENSGTAPSNQVEQETRQKQRKVVEEPKSKTIQTRQYNNGNPDNKTSKSKCTEIEEDGTRSTEEKDSGTQENNEQPLEPEESQPTNTTYSIRQRLRSNRLQSEHHSDVSETQPIIIRNPRPQRPRRNCARPSYLKDYDC